MKLFVVLAFVVTAGFALPTVPLDNSRYVANETRYVWIPDGEGVPQLVDLHEPVNEEALKTRNGANNQYWLYTRQNRNTLQVLTNGNLNSIRNSNFDSGLRTHVIIHGWNNDGFSTVVPTLRDAFLDMQNCNVIVVDWRGLANENFSTATAGAPDVGRAIGQFLTWLVNNFGVSWNWINIIGYSLGGHIAGAAGRAASSRPRIMGLDPAGMGWQTNSQRLSRQSGTYVEAIHTDGGMLGIFDQVGHADFYPNGGQTPQPGCLLSSCSHSRSFHLYAATIRNRHLRGRLCTSMLQMVNNWCSGREFIMGTADLNKFDIGIFRLSTTGSFPF